MVRYKKSEEKRKQILYAAYREINSRFYDNCARISAEIVELGQREGVFDPRLPSGRPPRSSAPSSTVA
ncbi:hypothetical protein [Paenibacillus durus]|uniref:hypothetical protein n=1 Tax=Paenibacillus durus TaxID=44251 RepID=UPI0004720359|nr:hypothetical protein [Paenibacillus durus]